MSKSLEAEQHLIACALVDDSKTAELLEIPEDWFDTNAHKLIYRTIQSLASQSLSADMFAVSDELERNRQLEMAGGMAYITELAEQIPNINYWNSYKNALFNYYKTRMVAQVKQNLEMQIGTGAKPEEMIEYLQTAVIDLTTDHHKGGLESISKHMDAALEYIEWKVDNEGAIMGLQSGYNELDYNLDGFQKGQLYAICGRPAMGKTMFALSIAHKLALQAPVCYYSLEMTGSMLSQRLIAAESGVSGKKFKQGTSNTNDLDQVAQAVTRIHANSKLHIDETAGLNVAQMRSRQKAFQIKHGKTGAIFVDHVGLLRSKKGQNDYEGLTETVHELQRMAKEFDCPLVMLSQLNRNCESRPDKRPNLSDIRQTGAIEEDCRGVMFVYRDEYYNENTTEKNITEVILAKNTQGETGSLYFHHDLSIGKYEPISNYEAPEEPKKASKF